MKKAFLLIEVMISIVLISGVILTLFKIQSENMNFLTKATKNKTLEQAINIISLSNQSKIKSNIENGKIYFKDVVDIQDDDVRKIFKNISVSIKEKKTSSKQLKLDKITIDAQMYSTSYSTSNNINKSIYSIKLRILN